MKVGCKGVFITQTCYDKGPIYKDFYATLMYGYFKQVKLYPVIWWGLKEQLSRVMRKPTFCICENKDADQHAKLISVFVFATWIVQYLFFLHTKFQASSHLQWLCCLVCVRPVQNPHCWFSHVAAQLLIVSHEANLKNIFCFPLSRLCFSVMGRSVGKIIFF